MSLDDVVHGIDAAGSATITPIAARAGVSTPGIFDSRHKAVMPRWPHSLAKGAEFAFPQMA